MAAVGQPGRAEEAASQIMAMPAAELVALVEREDASTFERAKAMARLGVVGGDDATRALAAQLGDEELNAYARSALEAIGDAAADAALREAAGKLSGRPLVGVLNSIGQRRDEQAVGLLEGHLKNGDADVRSAAAVALGKIGSPAAAQALTTALAGDRSAAPGLGDACLICADQLARSSPGAAAALYDRLATAQISKPVTQAAILGRVRLPSQGAAKEISEQLGEEDLDFFQLGLTAARETPGKEAAAALLGALPKLAPERQALVLRALGDRPEPLPLATLVAEANSHAEAVRAAAIDVMAEMNDAAAAQELVNLAFGESAAAPLALARLKSVASEDVDRAIVEQAAKPELRTNAALIELVGTRRLSALKPLVRELASHADDAVRRAAIASLGQVAELADLDALIERAGGDGDEGDAPAARHALRTAALRLDDRDACAGRLAQALDGASPDTQAYLLQLLREIGAGCDVALQTVVAAAKSNDATLKEAATRELGAWPTAAAGAALLDLAKNDAQEKYRIRALRGYIRIARQLQLSDQERLQFFQTAMDAAPRDEERRLALGILERIPSAETLKLTLSYLDQDELASAAAESAVNVASRLILTEPAAVAAAMTQLKSAPGVELTPEASQTAEALLQRAGGAR